MRVNTVTAPSVSGRLDNRQPGTGPSDFGFGISRQERRSSLRLTAGEVFNPFQLFNGAIVPSEILRSPDLLPSEKLVFARLLQFAGGKGRAWPSIQRLADEVALSVPQTRRCIRALESDGLIRRVARSGRSNEFEFLWHAIYEQKTRLRSGMSGVPQPPVSTPLHSRKIGPGRSSEIARRESTESSSSKESQFEENQAGHVLQSPGTLHSIADDCVHRRDELADPEQEFLLRLKERHGDSVDRHAILQCVTGDLKSFSDWKPFLDFEKKQTTAPHQLRNPAGHYRRAVQKFYETRAKQREWDIREHMRAIQAKIGLAETRKRPACTLSRCNGTGEVYDSVGLVSACECPIGQKLTPEVLALFKEVNTVRTEKMVATVGDARDERSGEGLDDSSAHQYFS